MMRHELKNLPNNFRLHAKRLYTQAGNREEARIGRQRTSRRRDTLEGNASKRDKQ